MPSPSSHAAAPSTHTTGRPRIAIIGGGPGGLVAAYLLERRVSVPCEIVIYEASQRLGGKICTGSFESNPARFEAGTAELYDYSQLGPDPLKELIGELGLATAPMAGGSVILGGRLIDSPEALRNVLGAKAASSIAEFTRRARSLISPSDYYESDWRADNADPLSLQDFHDLLGRVPDEAARNYLRVAVHSDLACEPYQTSAAYGLQNCLMDEPDYMRLYTIVGGIERLTGELSRRISARVYLNTPVVKVEKVPEERYRVHARPRLPESAAPHWTAPEVGEDFDFVVVALPNNWIPAIRWGGEVLAGAMHRHHLHYDHPAHYLRVTVLFERPFWRGRIRGSYFMLDSFGGCCVYDQSPVSGPGILSWLIAGDDALNLSNLADGGLADLVLESLPAFLGDRAGLFRECRVHRWVGSVNALPGGRPAREPDSRHQPEPSSHPGLFVLGDYLFDSTINGIVDSADVVSDWIREEVESAGEQAGPASGPAQALPVAS